MGGSPRSEDGRISSLCRCQDSSKGCIIQVLSHRVPCGHAVVVSYMGTGRRWRRAPIFLQCATARCKQTLSNHIVNPARAFHISMEDYLVICKKDGVLSPTSASE